MFRFVLLGLFFFVGPLYAELEVHNTILISCDGLSRRVLYALFERDRLNGISEVVSRGTILNMETGDHKNSFKESYGTILSGYVQSIHYKEIPELLLYLPQHYSLFARLKNEYPNLHIGAIINRPKNKPISNAFSQFFKEDIASIDSFYAEAHRDSSMTEQQIMAYLDKAETPFFLFVNFSDIEYAGTRYREGCEEYTAATLRVDRTIHRLVKALKTRGIWDSTEIFITNNFGFEANSRSRDSSESWIVSTIKMHQKGTHRDIVPTILELYRVVWRDYFPSLKGKALTY